MRIGFDAKRAFHNSSGLGNFSRTVIRSLSSIYPDHQYFLFTPAVSNKFAAFPPENVIPVEPGKAIDRLLPSYWRSIRMGDDIASLKIDIYHGLSNELPQNINQSGTKSVVTIHDLIFLRYPHLYKSIDRYIYKNKFFAACKMAEKIIAISEQTRTDLISFFNINPDKIDVIYQGCDPSFYQIVPDEKKALAKKIYNLPETFMLYVGTVEERKNLLQIIKARHEYGIDLPLVAIGRPTAYMSKIKEYISKQKITDIRFMETVPLSELPAIYQMSSVFVYPSSFEGFGIPILEALNSGVPVIAAKGSCLEETGGIHSLYIDPENPEEIAVAVNNVLSDNRLREKMIEEGFKHALNFREEKTSRKIMELYQKLL